MADQPAQIPVNSATFRADLRRAKIAARQALAMAEHQRASTAILDRLGTLLMPRAPGVLAFCWPIRNEVDCRPLAERLQATGWRAAMPVVTLSGAPMTFRSWTPGMAMASDPHGIPIPDTPVVCHPDVLLLPLVAFDAAGYRLGYGGGYFDRTLAACVPRPLSIGVGFECGRVPSIQPEAHDIPLDCIVTEAGTYFPPPP